MTSVPTVHNFSAGPAVMPPEVLELAQQEFRDWQGRGMSVLEMPFTSGDFPEIMASAKQKLRQLLEIPDDYHILFMQGGASAQFSLVPLNLLPEGEQAVYIETGHWSARALREAQRYGLIGIGASSRAAGFTNIPEPATWQILKKARYCHITTNETANGVAYPEDPNINRVPLVADMTSDFLSRPIHFDNYGLIYAGTQKNIGPAGLVIVIIREDLTKTARRETPTVFSYQSQIEGNNRLNTPLTYSVYLAGLVFDWVQKQGGVAALAERNRKRTQRLYRLIDRDPFYINNVLPPYRSTMNVCFQLPTKHLEEAFLQEARTAQLLNLRGHGEVGGIRASLYNAQSDSAVQALMDFMEKFRFCHG